MLGFNNTKMQNKNNNNTGYTIIETMVAISIFIIIVMMGMGALLNANLLHGKSQDMRSIMDNLSFMMEDMSRSLRTGVNYHCIDGTPNGSDSGTNTHSCANGGGIAFKPANGGGRWVYYVGITANGYGIFKSIDGVTVQLTTDEIVIDAVASGFSVLGAEPRSLGDNQQPFVTIKLVGTITLKNVVTPFSLQTSVSQRIIDIL